MLLKKIRFSLYFILFLTLSPFTFQSFHSSNPAIAQLKPIAQTVPQPLTLYQPLQHLQWEGERYSQNGIAYFPPEKGLSSSYSEHDLEVARTLHDPHLVAEMLSQLALSYHLNGEYFKALPYYQEGLEIAKKNSDSNLELMILGNLGLLNLQSGFYNADTFDYLNDYAASTQGRQKIQALGNLANAYFGADLYGDAIALHQKRLILSRQAKDQASEARTLSNLGIVYQALGESDKAINYQEQALTLAQNIKDSSIESFALGNLGIIYQTQRNYPKATESLQKRLTLSRQLKDLLGEAETLANLGGVAYFEGDYKSAIALYDQAWKISWNTLHDGNILFRIRGNQGLIHAQMGNVDKAIEAYQTFSRYASSRNSRREEGIAKINVAALRFQSGNLATSAQALRDAIGTWESLRSRLGSNDSFKISIFETQNVPYNNLQSVLVAQNQPDAALEISERGRARAFAELLARRLSARLPQKASSDLPLASPTIAQIKQIAKNHRSTLVEYSIISGQFTVKGKLETHESELLIWVVQPTGTITLRRVDLKPLWQCQDAQSCDSEELVDLVTLSRAALRGRGDNTVTPEGSLRPLNRLHKLLIQPIIDLLPQDPTAQVVFIPHRSLLLVPFAALPDAQGKFLIEQHTISIAPSIQVLDLTEQLRKRLGTHRKESVDKQLTESLVIGNPTMPKVVTAVGEPSEQLPSLPGSEQEAIAIARILNSSALIGGAATKFSVLQRMSHSAIIHLATHGLMEDFVGLGVPGAIALAPDATPSGRPSLEENGLLTASEILDLRLNAELVVLSACNTGRGKITGDGVVGLSRALIAARVPSVVVSLWSVPDDSTSLLMTEFYRNIQRQPDKAQAMRQAMLTTMKQYPAPLDWAAFMLIGETN
jgi:CHAT domain-containing protein